ncbi:hypothetical protein IVB18_17960 [Bradyrhizobium sp. 186]|uniref:hypothetical protein n=1 Tax=Bradyrhizobium sp. 186 TaxID=2782654 RepID=UPI002000F4DE|nr:hypothetical protein [Bradyrhizobium sp. 186]UPK38949.1 hypothetical protein IVB18_17960 [Bradyrhizobium sp. 186]
MEYRDEDAMQQYRASLISEGGPIKQRIDSYAADADTTKEPVKALVDGEAIVPRDRDIGAEAAASQPGREAVEIALLRLRSLRIPGAG